MIMRVDIMDRALSDLRKQTSKKPHVILTSAKGTRYTQQRAQALSKLSHLILIAGHYEGVDQRVYDHLVDEVVSIGDYVLTGGELPTMVLVDTLVRLIPGVLGNPQSLNEESHSKLKNENYLEYPQYTRPENYKGWTVPKVLLSGDPKKIKSWQNKSHTTKKSNSIGSLP
jgi:tRNA (guanine37-N1)-methyltransferase